MPKTGEYRIQNGWKQMYTMGKWRNVERVKEPTQKLDETQAPETKPIATDLAKAGGEIRKPEEKTIDTEKLMNQTAGAEDILEMYAQQLEKRWTALQQTQKPVLERLKSAFKPSKAYEEEIQKLQPQITEIQQSIAKSKEIRQRIIDLEKQRDELLATEEQKPVSMATISRRQQKIIEDYNRRIAVAAKELSAESAYQSALQGQINMARSMIEQKIQYATWEENQRVNLLEETYNLNRDLIREMGSDYDKIFQLAINEARDRRDETEAEKTKIAQLELDAATNYGIKLDLMDKSYDEALKIYNKTIAPLAKTEREIRIARERKLAEGETGTTEPITPGQILFRDNTIANRFDADLEQVYMKVISGAWGTEGARERARDFLVAKYPSAKDEINEIIYGSDRFNALFPDGYESQIQPRWKPTTEETEGSSINELRALLSE